MANTNIELVGLDFNTIKSNFKNYLRTNTQFKDVDFDASNIGVLIELLAYNTYLNGFYTNMVGSEMWLDSAQLRDSVVSHARELNYTPQSYNSATAQVTVDITPSSSVTSVVVPKYTSFSTTVDSNTYTFTTNEAYVLTQANNGTYSFSTTIYEGTVLDETFVVDNLQTNRAQRFVLSNDTVDTNSITVKVYENSGQTVYDYVRAHNLVGLTSTSLAYFVQAAENGQYEIVFGDDNFGRRPKNGATVLVSYRSTTGELPNGASVFISDQTIDGHANVVVTTVEAATGGAVAETTESIRFNAPRAFVTQGRAVTVGDYEVLLKSRFPEIQAVSVFGGEEADPPQYGKVFISTDLYNADGTSVSAQNRFLNYLRDKVALTITPVFIQPEFLHAEVITNVEYNITKTSKTTEDIKLDVLAAIAGYADTELNDFKTTLYYSRLTSAIDAADPSIIGNDTEIIAIKEWRPTAGVENSVLVTLGARLETETGQKLAAEEPHYGHTIYTTTFVSSGQLSMIVDDTLGNLLLAAVTASGIRIIKNVGTVDYTSGKVNISGVLVDSYNGDAYVKVFMKTLSKNIPAVRNTIITLNMDDVTVNVVGVNP